MSVFCLIAVRNEARYLPGFLKHVRDFVDGIIALDDCSTDATADILKQESRVVSILREDRAGGAHENETTNRHRLLVEASRLKAGWVICADADERFERAFLERLPTEMARGERTGHHIRNLKIVNLWNSPTLYRADGLSGPRWAPRMFKMPPTITKRPLGLHRPWFPRELDGSPQAFMNAYHYHLRMIDRHDRVLRYEKFRSIDPCNVQQPIGYDHLIDEAGLDLRPIMPWRAYTHPPEDDWTPGTVRKTEPDPVVAEKPNEGTFDEAYYLNRHVDVRDAVTSGAFRSGWEHYMRHGSAEGREWRYRPSLVGLDFQTLVSKSRMRRR